MTEGTDDADRSRRSVLKRGALASTVAVAGLAGCVGNGGGNGTTTDDGVDPGNTTDGGADPGNGGNRVFKRFVIRTVEGYEDDFVGRILAIDGRANADTSDVPVGECGFADWSPETALTYDAQFLDHRPRPPVSVPLIAYAGRAGDPVDDDDAFIINDVSRCSEDYVGIEAEWFEQRPLSGHLTPPQE